MHTIFMSIAKCCTCILCCTGIINFIGWVGGREREGEGVGVGVVVVSGQTVHVNGVLFNI